MEKCRICLSSSDLGLLFEDRNHTQRSNILWTVTGCKIKANDGLPQCICLTCKNLVDSAVKLRELSHYTEIKLLSSNTKKEVVHDSEVNDCEANIHLDYNVESIVHDDARFEKEKCVIDTGKTKKKCQIKDLKNHSAFNKTNENTCNKIRKRQPMPQEKLQKYLSLAATPYDSKGPVTCMLCRKELKTLRYFINHAKTHFAAEHACQVCGKEFVSPHSMRYHMMRLHGLEKRHPCQQCDFRGVDLDQLRNHIRRLHTFERPYTCTICGASFCLRAGLVQHTRKHKLEKTVQCERCSAMFRSRSELAGHRRRVHASTGQQRVRTKRVKISDTVIK